MDAILTLFLILSGLGIPAMAIAGLALGLSARRRTEALQTRVHVMEGELRLMRAKAAPTPPAAAEAPAPEPVREDTAIPVEPQPEPSRATSTVPLVPAEAPRTASAGPNLEEALGSRWAVWVGGVALALGGLFLVRYSIEQGLLDPQTRITLGGLFALALIGAGEWLRRRECAFALPGIPNADVPSILTAAGTCAAFASAYASYALYDLIGPAATFVLLGAIAVLTMVASKLHGPILAALGLLGAMGSPLLVSSGRPQPWALVIYLIFVVLPAYGVARFRLWRWLALAAAVGALIWTLPIFFVDQSDAFPAMVHLVLQTGFAAFFLAVDPYRHVPDGEARTDWGAGAVMLAFALAGIVTSGATVAGDGRPVFVGAVALILLAAGLRAAPVASAAASAALLAAGTLLVWPIRRDLGTDPENLFYQSGDAFAVRPHAVGTYLVLACLLPPAIAGASLLRLARSRGLRLSIAAWYAGAATAGPLLALVVSYWRIAEFERSLSFALVAAALASAFVGAASWLNRQPHEEADAVRLGLGATASAALAALALGLTFALDKGMLTVAFALMALGTAWIADRVAIPALRYAVGAIGVIVLGRLIWDPTIVGGDPGPVIVNWLLWGYGVPAVSFLLASRLLERTGRDRVVQLMEGLTIAFTAFLMFYETIHALPSGAGVLNGDLNLLEAGLLATESLVFAIVLTRMNIRLSDPIYCWGSLIFKIVPFYLCWSYLILDENPLLRDREVLGGVIFNALIPAYLFPAFFAGFLAWIERNIRSRPHVAASAALSLLMQWAYVVLEVRRIFHGSVVYLDLGFTQGEQWTYSVLLLLMGIALLGFGLLRDNRFARLASAVYLVLAVLKVFIIDLANLEGVMRALSFIGLGLVLIGIGLVYQRLLAHRPSNAAISP